MKPTGRLFFAILLILVLLITLAIPVFAASPGQNEQPPQVPEAVVLLIPILVGSIGIPLINFLKKQLGWTDKTKNLWLSFGVSMALAILALLATSSFLPLNGPETLVTWISLAFTTATLIYKSISQTPEPVDDPTAIR